MKVRVRFFAQFRELFGGDAMLDLPEETSVLGAVRQLALQAEEGKKALFEESGELREYIVLMRNGKRIETDEAGEILLGDGDEIAVFPPVAGG
jgi:molybdopterin synthase sulfur carrier subunit